MWVKTRSAIYWPRTAKALEGDEKKKEDQRFSKEFDAAKKKQAELANDPKKQQKEDEREQAQISDFLRAENFTNPRREIFRGQEVIVFDFGPNPDYKPKNMIENLVQKLVGVIWVDEQARDVVRLEARFSDNFKIAGGAAGFPFEGLELRIRADSGEQRSMAAVLRRSARRRATGVLEGEGQSN